MPLKPRFGVSLLDSIYLGGFGRTGKKRPCIASPGAQACLTAPDVEEFFRRRVVELKHGRVSMLVPRPAQLYFGKPQEPLFTKPC